MFCDVLCYVRCCYAAVCVVYIYLHVPLIWFGRIVHNGLYRFPLLILYSFSTFLHFCTPAYLHRVLLMSYCFFILLLVMSLSPESSHINCIIYPSCHLSSSLVTRVGTSSVFDVCALRFVWQLCKSKLRILFCVTILQK